MGSPALHAYLLLPLSNSCLNQAGTRRSQGSREVLITHPCAEGLPEITQDDLNQQETEEPE